MRLAVRLRRARDWHQMRSTIPDLLPYCTRHDRAELHMYLCTALFLTATGKEDYRQAFDHALACRRLADRDSFLFDWILQKLASLAVTLDRYREAKQYGQRYLQAAKSNTALRPFEPWVLRAIGYAYYRRGQYANAIKYRRKALTRFAALGNEEEVLRTRCNLVWACVKAGQINEAKAALPRQVPPALAAIHQGARCILLAAQGRYEAAQAAGQAAISGDRAGHDSVDAAEIAIILSRIAKRSGQWELARALLRKAAEFAARQGHKLQSAQDERPPPAPVQTAQPESPSLIAIGTALKAIESARGRKDSASIFLACGLILQILGIDLHPAAVAYWQSAAEAFAGRPWNPFEIRQSWAGNIIAYATVAQAMMQSTLCLLPPEQ